MKKINNILKLANYFYELNNFTKFADDEADAKINAETNVLFNEIEQASDNYELKANLAFLKSLFKVFSKNGNGFNELNQAILGISNDIAEEYDDYEENLNDEYMDQIPEEISKLGEFLNILRTKIKDMPKSNKPFTNEEVRNAKEESSKVLASEFQEEDIINDDSKESEGDKEYYTDDEIEAEDKKYLTEVLGYDAGQFEKAKGDAEERKGKQSYSMVFLDGGKDIIKALQAEKADVLANKEYYKSDKKIAEQADILVDLINQLIPEVIKANENTEAVDLKQELNTLFSLQYSEPEYIDGKKKRKKLDIPGLSEKIKAIKDKLNTTLATFKSLNHKKTLARNKFVKLVSRLKFQEFEMTDSVETYANKSPLEIMKIKNLGQLIGLRTRKFVDIVEEKKLRKKIDESIDAILENKSNKTNVLTEASIIKELERADAMAAKRKLNPTMHSPMTHGTEFTKKLEIFRNSISVFFTQKGYGITSLAANIANDAAFEIMEKDESLTKFLQQRTKLKELLKPKVMKLEELYMKYNSEEDITIKTKLNYDIIKLSVEIKDAGKKLITEAEFGLATKPKNADSDKMWSFLDSIIKVNIAPYITRMERIRLAYTRASDKRSTNNIRDIINAYKTGGFDVNFEKNKKQIFGLMDEFKKFLIECEYLLHFFSIDKILSEGQDIYNILESMISNKYNSEDIVTSFLNLKEELKVFGAAKKKEDIRLKDISPKLLELKQQNLDYLKELKSKNWVHIVPEKRLRILIDDMFYAESIDEKLIRSRMAEANIMTKNRTLNPTYFWGGKHDKIFEVRRLVQLSNALSVFFTQSGYGIKVFAQNIANDAFYKIMENDQDLKDFMEQRQVIKQNLKSQIKKLELLQNQYNKSTDVQERTKLNIEIIELTLKIRKVGFKLVTSKDFGLATKPKNADSPYVKGILNKIIDKNIAPYIAKMETIRTKFTRITETRDQTIFAQMIEAYRKGWFTQHVDKYLNETHKMLYELTGMLNDFESIDDYFALAKIIEKGRGIVTDLSNLEAKYSKINKQAMSGMLKNLENFLDLQMEIL